MSKKEITYFWNEDFNLLETVHEDFSFNASNKLRKMINKIEKNLPENPDIVVAYICKYLPRRSLLINITSLFLKEFPNVKHLFHCQ